MMAKQGLWRRPLEGDAGCSTHILNAAKTCMQAECEARSERHNQLDTHSSSGGRNNYSCFR